MKRLFNPRPILYVALSHMAGVLFAAYFPTLGAWALIIPSAVVFAVSSLVFAFYKNARLLTLITALLCIVFALVGGFSLKVKTDGVISRAEERDAGRYVISGTVDYVGYSNGLYNVRISDCVIDGSPVGNASVYGLEKSVEVYDRIELDCNLSPAGADVNGRYSSVVLNGSSLVSHKVYSVKFTGVKVCAGQIFKQFTDDKFASLSRENRATASALLRGDVSALAQKADVFRSAGIAHVFAVSGLHVGLLYAVLSLIFNKIPVNRTIKAVVISCLLFSYSLVCGFTASSLRAAVTCTVFALSKSIGEKRDSLNALSVAAVAVLLINPADLFGAGFVLSFAISLSLITVATAVARFTKIKSPELAGSISVIAAAQTVTIPLCVTYFGSFPLISLISNFLFVPVVTACYYAVVLGIAFSCIIPPFIALYPADVLLGGTEFFISRLARVNLNITVFPWWLAVVYFVALAACSDLFNLNKKIKISAATVVAAALIAITFASYYNFV